MKTLDDKLNALPKARRDAIEAHANEMIALELTLRQLREDLEMTQAEMAKQLEVGQDSVSRMESRRDMKLSTLQGYIEALGGQLNISATFPDKKEVKIQPLEKKCA